MKLATIRREIADLRQIAQADESLPPSLPVADESVPLARACGETFGQWVKSYREIWGLSPEEALARASEMHPTDEQRILNTPPDEMHWHGLDTLARLDPALALRRWEEVKQAARSELQSGHRAAQAMEFDLSSCWPRAQFLAIRDSLASGLRPRNGLEWLLIDMMTQTQTMLLLWQRNLAMMAVLAKRASNSDPYMPGHPLGRRLTEAETTEESAAMVERYHRLFLKTLEAFQKQRRLVPTVIVQRAGQVNVGGQQINVARP